MKTSFFFFFFLLLLLARDSAGNGWSKDESFLLSARRLWMLACWPVMGCLLSISLSLGIHTRACAYTVESVEFGHGLKDKFLIDPTYVNLNHGSFGACPVEVLQAQQAYVRQQESRCTHTLVSFLSITFLYPDIFVFNVYLLRHSTLTTWNDKYTLSTH